MDNIKVNVDPQVLAMFGYKFEGNIRVLLSFVPERDLDKLSCIYVITTSRNTKSKHARGIYDGYSDPHNMNITLCVSAIFPRMPRVVFSLLPILPRLFLAQTLFHEIGHHYHNMHYGIKKDQRERFADNYGKQMFNKMLFSYYGIRLLLIPLQIVSMLFKSIDRRRIKD